jgi:hypothetical protein
MSRETTLELVTYDPRSDEFVLYVVEDGPWPSSDPEWRTCLRRIQDRIFEAVDAAVHGGLAKKFADSIGKPIRVELDSPSGTPVRVEELVAAIRRFLAEDEEYRKVIAESPYIKALRLVTGKELGRFRRPSGVGDA